jgi:hypothetical protein
MTTTSTITPWFLRPTSVPTDFIGTETFVEKVNIIDKKTGIAMPLQVPFAGLNQYGFTIYFIFVMTPFGDMRIEVSKKVFDLLRVGKPIIVSYRRGRWTGSLKGSIAR